MNARGSRMNARDKATYDYYHPNEKNSAPTPTTRLEPLAVSHESPPTEQQQQNNDLGRRPMFVETADHEWTEPGTIHQRSGKYKTPSIEKENLLNTGSFGSGVGLYLLL